MKVTKDDGTTFYVVALTHAPALVVHSTKDSVEAQRVRDTYEAQNGGVVLVLVPASER